MDRLTSGIFYLFVIFITVLFAWFAEKNYIVRDRFFTENNQKILKGRHIYISKGFFCILMAVLIPSIVAGVRGDTVGTDVLGYAKRIIELADVVDSFSELNRLDTTYTEMGYRFFAFVVSRLFDGLGWFLFFTEILIVGNVARALYLFRKDFSIWKGMAIYMFCYYHVSFNMMRQCIAMSTLLVAFYYLTKESYLKYIVISIISFYFHTFAGVISILVLIIWVSRGMLEKRWQKSFFIAICICLTFFWNFIMVFLSSFFEGVLFRYARYFSEGEAVSAVDVLTSPLFLINVFLCASAYLIINNSNSQKLKYDNSLFLITFLGVIFQFLQIYITIIYRLGTYMQFFNILYIPRIFELQGFFKKRDRTIILIMVLFTYWIIDCMLSSHTSTAVFEFRY